MCHHYMQTMIRCCLTREDFSITTHLTWCDLIAHSKTPTLSSSTTTTTKLLTCQIAWLFIYLWITMFWNRSMYEYTYWCGWKRTHKQCGFGQNPHLVVTTPFGRFWLFFIFNIWCWHNTCHIMMWEWECMHIFGLSVSHFDMTRSQLQYKLLVPHSSWLKQMRQTPFCSRIRVIRRVPQRGMGTVASILFWKGIFFFY